MQIHFESTAIRTSPAAARQKHPVPKLFTKRSPVTPKRFCSSAFCCLDSFWDLWAQAEQVLGTASISSCLSILLVLEPLHPIARSCQEVFATASSFRFVEIEVDGVPAFEQQQVKLPRVPSFRRVGLIDQIFSP
mmetsp:Transcript_41479/g.61391  ORF Transcript_41479/g.61391 Transcript_41479/m.61391 type:complete len:134 (+) Transcript_41479:202-603(+)